MTVWSVAVFLLLLYLAVRSVLRLRLLSERLLMRFWSWATLLASSRLGIVAGIYSYGGFVYLKYCNGQGPKQCIRGYT